VNKQKSILDLNFDELKLVIESNKLPDNVTLKGLEGRDDFVKLYRFRASPTNMATVLLKEKIAEHTESKGGSQDATEIKLKRLQLKESELEIKRLKAETQTTLLKQLLEEMRGLHLKVNSILSRVGEEKNHTSKQKGGEMNGRED